MMLDTPTMTLVLAAPAASSTLVFLQIWLVNRIMFGVPLLFDSSAISLFFIIINFLATSIGLLRAADMRMYARKHHNAQVSIPVLTWL